jgi:hypothetical protein
MKTTTRVLTAAALCLVMQSALSQTTFGDPDCGTWIKSPRETDKAWLLGYLTGLNIGTPDSKAYPDPLGALGSAQQAYLWMDNFCQTNPLSKVGGGGVILFWELVAKRRAK